MYLRFNNRAYLKVLFLGAASIPIENKYSQGDHCVSPGQTHENL